MMIAPTWQQNDVPRDILKLHEDFSAKIIMVQYMRASQYWLETLFFSVEQ